MNDDVLENIIKYLSPAKLNLLMRASKRLCDALARVDEEYWSRTEIVRVFRTGAVIDGAVRLMSVKFTALYVLGSNSEMYCLAPVPAASREILRGLWKIRESYNDERRTVYIVAGSHRYLFKTMAAQEFEDRWMTQFGCHTDQHRDHGWPLWVR